MYLLLPWQATEIWAGVWGNWLLKAFLVTHHLLSLDFDWWFRQQLFSLWKNFRRWPDVSAFSSYCWMLCVNWKMMIDSVTRYQFIHQVCVKGLPFLWLYVVCCLLFVVCCLLFVVCYLLFVVFCLLFVVCRLSFVVCFRYWPLQQVCQGPACFFNVFLLLLMWLLLTWLALLLFVHYW